MIWYTHMLLNDHYNQVINISIISYGYHFFVYDGENM